MTAVAFATLLLALTPAILLLRNLRVFPRLQPSDGTAESISILIPARDEADKIAGAVQAAVANRGAEVLVLDDDSSDATAEIVAALAARYSNVRLLSGKPLPSGWCGKNWACAQLAAAATRPLLLFVDADVRLAPCAAATLVAWMRGKAVQLASGVPFQELGSFSERLMIPLIHFVLLGFLPLRRMRRSGDPAYAAGCGQLLIAETNAYREAGGHAAVRGRIHDGLALPRLFREHGLRTDLFDATHLATCRMYRTAGELWRGFTKNTHEGLGAPARIVPVTLLLLLGQVAPFLLLATRTTSLATAFCVAAIASVLITRLVLAARFRQPVSTALLHPVAIVVLLAMQWTGVVRWLSGKPARWKAREYASESAGDGVFAADSGEHLPERV